MSKRKINSGATSIETMRVSSVRDTNPCPSTLPADQTTPSPHLQDGGVLESLAQHLSNSLKITSYKRDTQPSQMSQNLREEVVVTSPSLISLPASEKSSVVSDSSKCNSGLVGDVRLKTHALIADDVLWADFQQELTISNVRTGIGVRMVLNRFMAERMGDWDEDPPPSPRRMRALLPSRRKTSVGLGGHYSKDTASRNDPARRRGSRGALSALTGDVFTSLSDEKGVSRFGGGSNGGTVLRRTSAMAVMSSAAPWSRRKSIGSLDSMSELEVDACSSDPSVGARGKLYTSEKFGEMPSRMLVDEPRDAPIGSVRPLLSAKSRMGGGSTRASDSSEGFQCMRLQSSANSMGRAAAIVAAMVDLDESDIDSDDDDDQQGHRHGPFSAPKESLKTQRLQSSLEEDFPCSGTNSGSEVPHDRGKDSDAVVMARRGSHTELEMDFPTQLSNDKDDPPLAIVAMRRASPRSTDLTEQLPVRRKKDAPLVPFSRRSFLSVVALTNKPRKKILDGTPSSYSTGALNEADTMMDVEEPFDFGGAFKANRLVQDASGADADVDNPMVQNFPSSSRASIGSVESNGNKNTSMGSHQCRRRGRSLARNAVAASMSGFEDAIKDIERRRCQIDFHESSSGSSGFPRVESSSLLKTTSNTSHLLTGEEEEEDISDKEDFMHGLMFLAPSNEVTIKQMMTKKNDKDGKLCKGR